MGFLRRVRRLEFGPVSDSESISSDEELFLDL
jgi:hypothetical protein